MLRSICALTLLGLACAAHAVPTQQTSLQPRDLDPNRPGHEAVYDQARNITWLADAQASPLATWNEVHSWALALNIGGVSGWRLATVHELFGLWQEWWGAGVSAYGGDWLSGFSLNVDVGLGSVLFTNARDGQWWDGTPTEPGGLVEVFDFDHRGTDSSGGCGAERCSARGWAVHSGDVAAAVTPEVPEPSAALLLGGGLALLAACRRPRRGAYCVNAPRSMVPVRGLPLKSRNTLTDVPASLL